MCDVLLLFREIKFLRVGKKKTSIINARFDRKEKKAVPRIIINDRREKKVMLYLGLSKSILMELSDGDHTPGTWSHEPGRSDVRIILVIEDPEYFQLLPFGAPIQAVDPLL